MVKYSEETEYEMIELSRLFDLGKSRIVQAQINSIDSGNNCASITLSSACDDLSAVNLDAVKFFYHCEFSTGTIEDLSKGHQAFTANDFVYCLWVPSSQSVEEQFYIIGHVDIRGTKRCANGDYVIISMGLNYEFSPSTEIEPTERWVTIFDVAMGVVLDLELFVPLDGSPPSPSSFPCKIDDTFTLWKDYNFEIPAARHSCPLLASEYGANISITSVVNVPVQYDGCVLHWRINYSDGGYEDHYAEANWYDLNSGGTYYRSVNAERSDHEVKPIERSGWLFTDQVTWETHHAYAGGERTVLGSGSCIMEGDVNATINYSHSIRYKSTFDNVEIVKESFSESAPFGPGFGAIRYQDTSFAKKYCVSVSGEYGFYVLCGGSESYHSRDLLVTTGIGTGGAVSSPCNEEIAFAQILLYPWEYDSVDLRSAIHTSGLSYCMVALFDDVPGDKEYTLSPSRCLSVMNHNISRDMEAAFAPLKIMVFNLTNDTRTYGSWAWEPPTLGIIKKK